jgi:hypothetical protein
MTFFRLLVKILLTYGKRSLAVISLPLLVAVEIFLKNYGSPQKSVLKFNIDLGNEPLRVAVYATYPVGTKTAEIEMMISSLKKLGYFVFLVTNSDVFIPFSSHASAHLIRRNRGRDLGAYREVFEFLKGAVIEEILLVNDSCYWNEDGLIETVNHARKLDCDVASITISNQRTRHLQTYFLMIKPSATLAVMQFFELRIKDWKLKRSIVTFGELKLTKWLENRGLRCCALFSESIAIHNLERCTTITLDEREAINIIKVRLHINPSQYFWKILWDDFGFVKKTLIYQNPLNLTSAPCSIEALPERGKRDARS